MCTHALIRLLRLLNHYSIESRINLLAAYIKGAEFNASSAVVVVVVAVNMK